MKQLLLFITLLLISAPALTAQTIGQITGLSYEDTLVYFGYYSGSIGTYENRLFTCLNTSVEELLVNEDGSLQTLSRFELGSISSNALIDEGRLYFVYKKGTTWFLQIFNLQTTPMTELITLPTSVTTNNIRLHVFGDYILLDDGEVRSFPLNKHTLSFETPIAGLYGLYAVKDNIFIKAKILGYTEFDEPIYAEYLECFDYTTATTLNPYGQLLCRIDLGNTAIRTLKVSGDYLFVTFIDRFDVYNISDIGNIMQMYSMQYEGYYFNDVLIYENYLIAGAADVLIFDITDPEDPQLAYTLETTAQKMCVYNDRLYINTGIYLDVYSITGGFTLEARLGNYNYSFQTMFDKYLVESHQSALGGEVKTIIHNMFDGTQNIVLEQGENYQMFDCEIKDNTLYALGWIDFEEKVLDIYDISDIANPVFILRTPLEASFIYKTMDIHGGNIIVSYSNFPQDGCLVYSFNGNEIEFIGSFEGSISRDTNYSHPDYFITSTEEAIQFRDTQNPFNVIYSMAHGHEWRFTYLYHIKDNLFCIRAYGYPNDICYFYSYNSDFSNFSVSTLSLYDNPQLSIYNGYMARHSIEASPIVTFYRFDNGEPIQIGEFDFAHLEHSVYIYPQQERVVLRTGYGLHIYAMEYTTSETDVVVKPPAMVLHANYPNPFNPETVISYSLRSGGLVELDVFNVRGQRVKTLVSGFKSAGEHRVLWNGTDDKGVGVASGVYFYRMKAGGDVAVRKMVLVK